MIHLYNTITKKIEPFQPISPPDVSLYVCGVTVYDYCHIGHARAYVAFDLLKRVLSNAGYTVNHIQNFTDIDDKIIQRSRDQGIDWKTLTETFIDSYFEDMDSLNILRANDYPKATESIQQMIDLILSLIKKNNAYEVNGTVYFRVNSCSDYGNLSKKNIDDQELGHRVDVEEQKESPLDFVLWKPSKPDEPHWDSPWGAGRPGWHTECVAMVNEQLGPHIDIHGGGADLQFPHHENELAQAKCAYHTPFANVWVHNGFVTVNDEKMSKSLNNFFTLRDVLKEYTGEVLRFFLMRTHYRAPLNYSIDSLNDAKIQYTKLLQTFDIISDELPSSELTHLVTPHKAAFWQALNNDLNISEAIAELFAIHKLIYKHRCGTSILKELGQSIGLFLTDSDDTIPNEILELAEQRWAAKKNRDFALADQLRDKIQAAGFILEDTPDSFRVRTS